MASVNALRIELGLMGVCCQRHIERCTAEHGTPQLGAGTVGVGGAEYRYMADEHVIACRLELTARQSEARHTLLLSRVCNGNIV